MLYKDDLKRYILYCFKKGFEDGLDEEEIIERLPEIPGNEDERQQFFSDCKAYLFINTVFINHPSIAITLAKKYIDNHNNRDVNLVDEKLFTMYSKTFQVDLACELLNKLLEKDPNNKWSIAKKLNILRGQGKHSEALELIDSNYDLVKNDPAIFDIQYKIVHKLTNGDPSAIINLFKRIPILKFGKVPEKRNQSIQKLQEYLKKTYILEKSCKPEDKEKIQKVRKQIKNKIKIETNKSDLFTVQSINNILKSRNYEEEDINFLLESIQNETIKFCMQCQAAHSQGKSSKDLAERVKNYSRTNSSKLDETSKKSIKVLSNLLTGSLRNIYLHNQWTRFQNHYFQSIINPNQQKCRTNENKKKSSGPTL